MYDSYIFKTTRINNYNTSEGKQSLRDVYIDRIYLGALKYPLRYPDLELSIFFADIMLAAN